MMQRVVFDTSTVVPALRFSHSRLAWLRGHWLSGCVPLVSDATVRELGRVLTYSKFSLTSLEIDSLLADYLPFCTVVEVKQPCPLVCRDPKDQSFLDLAQSGAADVLVTGDGHLLALAGQTTFQILSSSEYADQFAPKALDRSD